MNESGRTQSQPSPRVSVVIVNYRTADLAIDCLRSLVAERAALPDLRVVITDNASGDGSVERIANAIEADGFGAWARVMPLERNGGFAYGNNAAIRAELSGKVSPPPHFIHLLNPDCIVRPGGVSALARFLVEHPTVGIAGSLLEDASGAVQCSAHGFPSPLAELDSAARLGPLSRLLRRHAVSPPPRAEAHECAWVSGASMMIRREVFDTIGLMDEGYFLYFEEVDFCARARRAGWPVWYVPESRIVHLEGASTGIGQRQKRRGRFWYESRRRFFVKMYGAVGLAVADLLWAIGRTTLGVRRTLRLGGGANDDPLYFARDLLLGDLRALASGEVFQIDRLDGNAGAARREVRP